MAWITPDTPSRQAIVALVAIAIATTTLAARDGDRSSRAELRAGVSSSTPIGSRVAEFSATAATPFGTTIASRTGFRRIRLPTHQPSGVAWDGEAIWLTSNVGPRSIFRLDAISGEILDEFLAPSPDGLDGRSGPNGLAYDGDSSLFVVDIGDDPTGTVYEVDFRTKTILGSFELPFRGGSVAWHNGQLYSSDFDSDLVIVTDRFGSELRRFRNGLRPAGMTIDPRSGHLWVVSIFDTEVTEVSPDGEILRRCIGPRIPGPQGMGAVTFADGALVIVEASDPDPFNPPDLPGTAFVVGPAGLRCDGSVELDGIGLH